MFDLVKNSKMFHLIQLVFDICYNLIGYPDDRDELSAEMSSPFYRP